MKNLSLLLGLLLIASTNHIFAKDYPSDTTVISFRQPVKAAKIIKNDKSIIVKKGDVLTIDIEESQNPVQIRVHSSLGRLVKNFKDVFRPVSMGTDNLQPGVYLVVIKKGDSREIRKVLLTE